MRSRYQRIDHCGAAALYHCPFGAGYVPFTGLVTAVSARMQVVLFRRRRRGTDVSKLLVSRRADELDRFQRWSGTPAAVEVREASDRRHSICRAAFVSRNFVHKGFSET